MFANDKAGAQKLDDVFRVLFDSARIRIKMSIQSASAHSAGPWKALPMGGVVLSFRRVSFFSISVPALSCFLMDFVSGGSFFTHFWCLGRSFLRVFFEMVDWAPKWNFGA